MKRLFVFAIVALMPTLALSADTYTIKLKKREKGDTLAVTTDEKSLSKFVVVGPDGKEIEKNEMANNVVAKYREAVMEKEEGKRPHKLKRTYDQATVGDMALVYNGKTIVIQKVDNVFKFFHEGKELKADDVGSLSKEFSDPNKAPDEGEKHFLPNKPVAVNETWTPNIKETFKGAFGDTGDSMFDLAKAVGLCKLTKVYTSEKKTFGVIEIELTAPLKLLPGNNFPCLEGSKFQLNMTLDVCIDGTEETGSLKGEMKLIGTAKVQNNGKDTGNLLKFTISATTLDSKLQYTP